MSWPRLGRVQRWLLDHGPSQAPSPAASFLAAAAVLAIWAHGWGALLLLVLLLALLLGLVATGGAVLAAAGVPPPRPAAPVRAWHRLPWAALAGIAGIVVLHLLLLGMDAAGILWRRRTMVAGLLLVTATAGALAWRRRARRRRGATAVAPGPAPPEGPTYGWPTLGRAAFGWGDAVALAAVAAHAVAAWTLRIGTPDFVFHWGVKGRRFALAGGIDWAYLTDPLRLANNPEYPHLLPNLYAATAHVAGGWLERPMLLWSTLFLGLVWVFTRQAAAEAAGGLPAQAATAAVVATSAMFGIGYDMAGGADWLVLLALAMAAAPLLRPAAAIGRADDLQLGFAAALAAGGKAEGVPLAAILLAVQGFRLLGRGARVRRLAAFAAAAALPPALVVAPWLAAALRLDLFSLHKKTGGLDLGRLPVVATALAETSGTVEWHGMLWLLLLLPAVLLARRTRALGAVLVLQLLVYLWVYLTAPLDTRFYVLSSFPRLAFHLLPLLMLALVAAAAPPNRAPPDLNGHET